MGRSSDSKDKSALEIHLAEGTHFCLLGPLFSAENQEQVGFEMYVIILEFLIIHQF